MFFSDSAVSADDKRDSKQFSKKREYILKIMRFAQRLGNAAMPRKVYKENYIRLKNLHPVHLTETDFSVP